MLLLWAGWQRTETLCVNLEHISVQWECPEEQVRLQSAGMGNHEKSPFFDRGKLASGRTGLQWL